MHALPNLPFGLPGLPVIQPDPAIRAHAGEHGAIRAERSAEDKLVMLAPQARVELERRAVVEDQAGVVAAGDRAEGPLLPYRDAIDPRRVPGYLAHAVAAVGRDAVAEPLLPVPDGDDALGVAVPGEVVDAAGYDVVFACAEAEYS